MPRPCQALALHTYCTLQIPNCPRESNEATAASKSLRHSCPSRLRATGAQQLRDRVWGQMGESRGRQPPRMCAFSCVYAHPDTVHAVLEACSGEAPGVCTLSHSNKHTRTPMCGWAVGQEPCTYLHLCLQSLQGASAPGSPQPLSAMLGLIWTAGHAQSIISSDHLSLRSSPNLSVGF